MKKHLTLTLLLILTFASSRLAAQTDTIPDTRVWTLRECVDYALEASLAVKRSALDVEVKAPMTPTTRFGDMPSLDVSASYDEAGGKGAVFIVNRSMTESVPVDLRWQDGAPKRITAAHQMAGTDPKAFNSFENPSNIISRQVAAPAVSDGSATLLVPPLSFTAVEVAL